jgi:outer membrane protein assembly factor BamE (lipoprotein component of BamABCDE complex)
MSLLLCYGCGFPSSYEWPEMRSPKLMRTQVIRPGMTKDDVHALLGNPNASIDMTHVANPSYYVGATRVVWREAHDAYWIKGTQKFVFIVPPGWVKDYFIWYKLSVDYDGNDNVTECRASAPTEHLPEHPTP